jgi:hypothetical protein
MNQVWLADREPATVLAALRLWQAKGGAVNGDLLETARNGGRFLELGSDEIDGPCERLNCGG